MSDHILQLTDDTFEQDVIKSSDPVLVDYWAEWCGPCKMIAPILEEIATEYTTQVRHPRHPDPDAVQGRQRRGHQGRRPVEITTHGIH